MSLDALLSQHGSRASQRRDISSQAFLTKRERQNLKRKSRNAYEAPDDEEDDDEGGGDNKVKDDGLQSDSDVEEDEGDESDAEDLEKNKKERKKAKGARDGEMVASARLRKQGIVVDDETADDSQGYATWKKDNQTNNNATDKQKEKDPERAAYQAKLRSLFDKREGEQFESFHMNTDPEKSNKNDDAWLDEVDEHDKRQAALDNASSALVGPRATKRKAEGGIGDSDDEDDDDMDTKTSDNKSDMKEMDPIQARYTLVKHMKPGETVLKAVKRLGGEKSTSSSAVAAATATLKKKNIRAKDRAAAEATLAANKHDEASNNEQKQQFNEITDAAQTLLNAGFIEIYSESYEKIQYFLKQHEAQKSNPTSSTSSRPTSIQWEYKWSTDDDNKHGPFNGNKMNEYRAAGYFQKDVVVRRVGTVSWISASLVPDFNSTEVTSSTSTSKPTSSSISTSTASQPPKKKFKF